MNNRNFDHVMNKSEKIPRGSKVKILIRSATRIWYISIKRTANALDSLRGYPVLHVIKF